MQELIRIAISALLFFSVVQSSCTKQKTPEDFFPGTYPGKALYNISDKSLVLSNNAISADWGLADNSVFLKSVTNKYDGENVSLENVILFAIELEGGIHLTNKDFKLKSEPLETDLASGRHCSDKGTEVCRQGDLRRYGVRR